MDFLIKTIAFAFVIFISSANQKLLAQEGHIQMLAGLSKPPFVIPEQDKGMQLEIIKAAFAISNRQVNFTYLPISRHIDVYKKRNIEGLITLSESETQIGLYLSKPYITYTNMIVTLKDKKLKIKGLSDLFGMRVAGFQNATKFLGKEYRDIFLNSESYLELADQKSQLSLLFTGRVDAIVIDKSIFNYLLEALDTETSYDLYRQEIVEYHIFKPKHYAAGFNSKKLQEEFDKGLKTIKLNGSYQKIVDSYLKR